MPSLAERCTTIKVDPTYPYLGSQNNGPGTPWFNLFLLNFRISKGTGKTKNQTAQVTYLKYFCFATCENNSILGKPWQIRSDTTLRALTLSMALGVAPCTGGLCGGLDSFPKILLNRGIVNGPYSRMSGEGRKRLTRLVSVTVVGTGICLYSGSGCQRYALAT